MIMHVLLSFFILLCTFSSVHAESDKKPVTIRKITVLLNNVFEDPDSSGVYKLANKFKAQTREDVIRREFLFKEGDPYDPILLRETARNLRTLKYLRQIGVVPVFDGEFVDITVRAQDTWTLIPYLAYSSGTGSKKQGIGISEGNLGGASTRVDATYQQDRTRASYSLGLADQQIFNTTKGGSLGISERSDGSIYSASIFRPFRSVLQKEAWSGEASTGNTIGRLFDSGTENYIFRQKNEKAGFYYTLASDGRRPGAPQKADEIDYLGDFKGVPVLGHRYTIGFEYNADKFQQADSSDYEDLDLNPERVSNDFARVPVDRRFIGPVVRFQKINPNYIPKNYIDRFDRPQDYNFGDEYYGSLQIAPKALGSNTNSLLLSGNRSAGWEFSEKSFSRGELGFSNRFDDGAPRNFLLHAEFKFYSDLGTPKLGQWMLGRHTFASNIYLDFGERFDKDRQLLVGGDNALRGYKANTFEGDKRFYLNLEERAFIYDDVLKLFSVGTAVFIDAGGATRGSFSSIFAQDFYSNVGGGLRLGFPRASGGGVFRLDIAFPLRDGPDGSGAFQPRIIAGVGQLFGSQLRSEMTGVQNVTSGVGFDR